MKIVSVKAHAVQTLVALSFVFAACVGMRAAAATLPPSTALPVEFTTTIEAGKTTVNEPVRARTMQEVLLPDGEKIPKGSIVTGHVVESTPFVFDKTPYAKQKPSVLEIHFDKIETKNRTWDANLLVRALANVLAVNRAETPYHVDETDTTGTMIQIGGDHYDPIGQRVYSRNGDIVAYKRSQGVFARLISGSQFSGGSTLSCDATMSEQSVAIFSASACGLYGFPNNLSMIENGNKGGGTFRLESARYTVKLYFHSAALLEVINPAESDQANAVIMMH